MKQTFLFPENPFLNSCAFHPFPSTRYQGSKAKIVDWIWNQIKHLPFHSALDGFGGSGAVAHKLKNKGKKVDYNDLLKFNYTIGKALIENKKELLDENEVNWILNHKPENDINTFIQDTFKGVFYLDEENVWLDNVISNIRLIANDYKQAIAWFALFQSCLIKRPYNLFHRANLNVRTNEVKRSFGNKASWDAPFDVFFRRYTKEANAAVFDNGFDCLAHNYDLLEFPFDDYDLVYFDSPYITKRGIGTDYLDYYHFLEGIISYETWKENVVTKYKHLPLKGKGNNPWIKKELIYNAFDRIINKFQNSIIVISYRSDGIPSESEIYGMLKKYKDRVIISKYEKYKYALSQSMSCELLFIAE